MMLNLTALGIVNALGLGAEAVAARLLTTVGGAWWQAGALAPRSDIVPGATLWVGAVTDPLPEIPSASEARMNAPATKRTICHEVIKILL
jgi:hypothetical protein